MEKKKNKLKLNICYAILSFEEATHFEQLMTGKDDIPIGDMMLFALSLTVRDPVLNYKNGREKSAPIPYLCYLNEFCNTQKEEHIRCVKAALGTSGKKLYSDMQGLLD